MKKVIAYITDTHLDEDQPKKYGADARQNFQRIIDDVRGRDVDEIVFGGDIGELEAYPWFFETLSDTALRCYLTPGNHDTAENIRKFYSNDYLRSGAEFCYSFESPDNLCIFLDSSVGNVSDTQLSWLGEQLLTEKVIVLFLHHPILHVDTVVDRKYPLENRSAIRDLLLATGKQCYVFCGHYHTEDRAVNGNITQFVTPAVSYQIEKSTKETEANTTWFAYRLIYFEQGAVSTEIVKFTK
jgi:Icc protein